MDQETELKFVGPEEALARLRRAPMLRRLARNRRPRTRALHALYFDTETLALGEAGLILRVRTDGTAFAQTVKSANGPNVATRTEVKAEVGELWPNIDAIPDKKLRRRIAKVVGRADLRPIFGVEVRRTTVLLTPRRGTEIEAAFDIGSVKTLGERPTSVPISEFELELLEGSPNDLIACARELTSEFPLTLSFQSKAQRGYALAQGKPDAPVPAGRIDLAIKATADEAFAQIIAHCLNHLLGNWPSVTQERDPEGIHQMRVASRRLRSALWLFGGPFRGALNGLEEELRWIAGVLGAARDLDVFQDEILRPAAEAHGDNARLDELATVVRTRRRIAWHSALEALESERFRKLALEIAAVTFSRPWLDASIGGERAITKAAIFARQRLAHRHSQALKLGEHIDELEPGERHELRKRLKKLRYGVDFFSSQFAKSRVKKCLKRLSDLQDVLGHMNDAVVARSLVGEILADHGDGAGAAAIGYAGGVVAGWHLGHVQGQAKELEKSWRRFTKTKPPWA